MLAHPERSRSRCIPASRRPLLERLEERLAPAGNLALVNAALVDAANQPLTAPVVGQQVFFRVNWTATGLAADDAYAVRFAVDGVTLDSAATTGSNGTFTIFRGTTFATPGQHTATLTIDGANTVTETDEGDNSLTINYTSVSPDTLPQKFLFPVSGVANRDYTVSNYVDVDPRAGTQADYRGGVFTADGHDGLDIVAANFSAQDAGVPVVAAANGTVTAVTDGNFDRETNGTVDTANFLVIDHGNGWTTRYQHLANGSITVRVGDAVLQGQLLGLMGSSGISTGPQVHWGVFFRGAAVETGLDPASYFLTPPPYQGDAAPTVMRSGISNFDPVNELREGPSTVTTFPTAQNWSVYYWYNLSHLKPASVVQVVWFRPDGTTFTTIVQPQAGQQPSSARATIGTNWKSAIGTWNAALVVDGVEIDRQAFSVVGSGGVSEIALRLGATSIVDNRLTPIDFGSVASGAAAIRRTYTISNLGAVPLSLANLTLPNGFTLASIFPSAIGANASATFDIQLETAVVGPKFGEIRVTTNDPDEPTFSFLIRGTVTGTPATGTPSLTLPGRAVVYGFGKAAVVLDAAADIAGVTAWNNTVLRASILTNASVLDRLAIRNEGTLANQVGFSGNNVTFGGLIVGTFAGGTGTSDLVITFNASATLTAGRAVLRNITYVNDSTSPDARPRFVGFTITTGGLTSDLVFKRTTSTATPINDAPVLNPSLVSALPPFDEDQIPVGATIGSFAASGVTDLDRFQPIGVAVIGSAGAFGMWQYSLNNGTTWLALGNVSASAALLLGPTALARFVPDADANGTATLTYRAWDGTTGTSGATVDLSAVAGGGRSAFSTATATSNSVINPINDAPTFTPGPNITIEKSAPLQNIANWATNISAGPANENQTVSFLVTVGDPTLFSVQPTVSPTGTLSFQPLTNQLGLTTITVQAQDSAGGLSGERTFTINIIPVNAAPVLVPFVRTLTDTSAFTVATLLGTSVTDADDGALEGIAVVGLTRTSGDWQYSLNGGTTWIVLSTASLSNARLLRATDLVRFNADTPLAGFGDLRFRAWDQTLGTSGGTADLSGANGTGGKTPFSTNEASATIFLGKGVLGLDEDPIFINGGFAAQLLRGDVIDADPASLQGVALIGGTQGSEGRWEFSLDGGQNWLPVGPMTPATARLLRPADQLRFVPSENYNGFFDITYRAWDQTSGVPGGLADLSSPGTIGGSTSFSSETLNYKDIVVSINDRPILTPGNVILTPTPVGATNPPGEPLTVFLGGRTADADGNAVGLAVVATDGPGTWQLSTHGGTTWTAIGSVSVESARLIPAGATTRIRFLPGPDYTTTSIAHIAYRGWDGTDGTAGGTIDVNTGTSVSVVEGTASVASNTAPMLDNTPLVTVPPSTPVTVASLINGAITDVDPGAVQGIAIVGTAGSGSWQYSIDGGAKWRPLVVLNGSSARLFRPEDLIRYLPRSGRLDGSFRYRAWDQSRGTAGLLDNPLAEGITAYSTASEIAVVNAAPTLNPTRVKHFPTRNEGAGPGVGTLVRDLLADAVRDNGIVNPRGIAVKAATKPTDGKWEFSQDGGATWQDLGDVSATGARLLRLFDRLRFVAPTDFSGNVFLAYHAWDQSNGTAGGLFSLANLGGSSPFSVRAAAARLTVTGSNDRPRIDTSLTINLASIAPGEVSNGNAVAALLAGVSDPDPGALQGVGVVGTSGDGVWQFSLNAGGLWQNIGNVNGAAALLLRPGDRVRFRPAAGFSGMADLTYRAWDRTAGTVGTRSPANGPAFSLEAETATLAVNTAPTLDTTATPTLPNVLEDEAQPDGATVASLLGTAVTDPDTGAVAGAAIVAAAGMGTWQFTLDGGTTWTDLGTVSAAAARLLGGSDKVRFVPSADFFGQATISYRAWDQTLGKAGDVLPVTTSGGSSPFSVAEETATVTVTPTNDRPTLTPIVATVLTSVRPGTGTPSVNSVSRLLEGIVGDPDPSPQFGVAVVMQVGGMGGLWQYSLDGGLNWLTMGTLSTGSALVLRDTDLVRFVPNANFAGKATLSYVAWDRTQGAAGDLIDTLGTASGAFSLETNTAFVPVNTAPALRG